MNEKNQQFVIVDGSSYLFRAYYALPPLTNSTGHPTGAIYGVINMLKKLLKQYTTKHITIIFDSKQKNFRHKLYKEYKANRAKMPEELSIQIEPLHNIIKALGIPLIIKEGIEADDVIGTLAVQASHANKKVIISTADKDMAQLVNDNITLINTMTDKKLDEQAVIEKFGVPPHQIIEYLTLIGDNVDNIPGIPKVGPKTATKWLKQYGSLQEVINHAEDIKGKVGENLRNHLNQIPLAQQLVTIKTDIELHTDIDDLTLQQPNNHKLHQYYKEFGFSRLIDKIPATPNNNNKKDYILISDKDDFTKLIADIQKAKKCAFDTETTSLNCHEAMLVGISIAITPNQAYYIPLQHNYENAPNQLDKQWVLKQLQPIFSDKEIILIAQNAKYDLQILKNEKIHPQCNIQDTMVMAYVINSSGRHDMNTLAQQYLNYNPISYQQITGKGKDQINFSKVDIEKACTYAAEDADITLQLYNHLTKELMSTDKKLQNVYHDIDLPLVKILADMEYTGIAIDCEDLKKQSHYLQQKLTSVSNKIFKLAGEEFNINSTVQLQDILFSKLELPILKKTPKGKPSTAENVLQELSNDYELPKEILEYRSLHKLKTTYTDQLPKQIDPKTNRIHTSFSQTGTTTGRLTSSNPNVQNIPIKSAQGRKIRQAFIAPRGSRILSADYSQVELRIMAHLSGDKNLIHAFENDLDIHAATAAEITNTSIENITAEQRRRAKAINFGIIYGMSSFGLSQQLKISRSEAQQYIDTYFEKYPKVNDYMEQTRKMAAKNGFVETIFSRKLYIPEINSRNIHQKRAAERAAINAPMQGSASDIIKRAMIDIQQWIDKSKLDIKMILQVHDELVFEINHKDIEQAQNKIKHFMENTVELLIPLKVAIGIGKNWQEAH